MNSKNTNSVVAWIFIVSTIFVFQELLFRLVFPLAEITNFNRICYTPTTLTEVLPKHHLSNSSYLLASDPDGIEFIHSLNLYGFRDRNWNVNKNNRYRIIIIGDSFVEGIMADDNHTIPNGFQRSSKENGDDIEVMNLGVAGAGFPEYFKLMRDAIPIFKPDNVLLIIYANDLPPEPYNEEWLKNSLIHKYSSFWLPRIVVLIQNIFNNQTIPRRWIAEPFLPFRSVPDPSNPWTNYSELFETFVAPTIAEAMKKGRFNPFTVDELNKYEKMLQQPIFIMTHLNALQEYLSKFKTTLMIAYIPSRHQISDYYVQYAKTYSMNADGLSLMDYKYQVHSANLTTICKFLKIPFLDLTPFLRNEEQNGRHLCWDYDEHMRGESNLKVGEILFSSWKKENFIQSLIIENFGAKETQ